MGGAEDVDDKRDKREHAADNRSRDPRGDGVDEIEHCSCGSGN